MNLRVIVCVIGVFLAACADSQKKASDTPIERDYIGPERRATATVDAADAARRQCEELMQRVLQKPAAPGAPGFEAMRAELLARAKAEPVIFVDTPRYDTEAPTK